MSTSSKFLTKVVPIALTIIGAASSIAAVIFAAKEGPKYQKVFEEEKEKGTELTIAKRVVTGAKMFAPAIGFAFLSTACAFGNLVLNANTQRNLIGAAALTAGGFKKIKDEYKKFRDKNKELNGEDANEKIFKEMLPEELRDGNGEKLYTIYLSGLFEELDTIKYRATKASVLWNILRVWNILDSIECISLNELLNVFGQACVDYGSEVGWSCQMLCDLERSPFLWFLVDVDEETNSIQVIPKNQAYGGYLTDYDLDW